MNGPYLLPTGILHLLKTHVPLRVECMVSNCSRLHLHVPPPPSPPKAIRGPPSPSRPAQGLGIRQKSGGVLQTESLSPKTTTLEALHVEIAKRQAADAASAGTGAVASTNTNAPSPAGHGYEYGHGGYSHSRVRNLSNSSSIGGVSVGSGGETRSVGGGGIVGRGNNNAGDNGGHSSTTASGRPLSVPPARGSTRRGGGGGGGGGGSEEGKFANLLSSLLVADDNQTRQNKFELPSPQPQPQPHPQRHPPLEATGGEGRGEDRGERGGTRDGGEVLFDGAQRDGGGRDGDRNDGVITGDQPRQQQQEASVFASEYEASYSRQPPQQQQQRDSSSMASLLPVAPDETTVEPIPVPPFPTLTTAASAPPRTRTGTGTGTSDAATAAEAAGDAVWRDVLADARTTGAEASLAAAGTSGGKGGREDASRWRDEDPYMTDLPGQRKGYGKEVEGEEVVEEEGVSISFLSQGLLCYTVCLVLCALIDYFRSILLCFCTVADRGFLWEEQP